MLILRILQNIRKKKYDLEHAKESYAISNSVVQILTKIRDFRIFVVSFLFLISFLFFSHFSFFEGVFLKNPFSCCCCLYGLLYVQYYGIYLFNIYQSPIRVAISDISNVTIKINDFMKHF